MQTAQQIEVDSAEQIVETINGKPVTRREITEAFNLVCDKTNWKFAIDITLDLTPAQVPYVHQAAIFFTGAPVEFSFKGKGDTEGTHKFRVTGPGYYNTCGA